QRLVWLVLGLAVTTSVLTPLTTQAGEWLGRREGRAPFIHTHTELGDTMLYFSLALVAAAALLALLHVREARSGSVKPVARWVITTVIVVASVAATVQVYRIGESGARATWGEQSAARSAAPG